MTAVVPVVDLEEWRATSAEARAQIASDLDRALRDSGMFLLRGHGVPREVTDNFRSCAKKFFALPREVKSAYAIEAAYDSGWLEMHPPGGVGVPKTYGAEAPTSPDLHESFYVSPTHRTGKLDLDRIYYPANRWPRERPEFRAAAEAYTAHMVRLAHDINELFAAVLGLPEDYFTSRAQQATWTQNASWYPSLNTVGKVASGQLRNGPHTDLGAFTVLSRQLGVGGLQAWNETDGWFAPPYDADAFVVNIGDLMELWTDGRWRALRHRVLAPSASAAGEELLSLAFFFETDPETWVEPMAVPVGGGRGLTPVRSRRSILEKLGVSFDPADSTA